MSHTVGEWTLNKKNGRIVECDGRKILTASSTPWDASEAWANARLVAAAPELLRLLNESVNTTESRRLIEDWLNEARTVIRKATGIEQ